MMPFGPYETFAACVAANQDKDDPEAYCGSLQDAIEGEDEAAHQEDQTMETRTDKARAFLRSKRDAFGREYRTHVGTVELRAAETDGTAGDHLMGHAAVFDQEIVMYGLFREKIAAGAFRKTIQEADVRHLYNHDPNWVLARTKNGTLVLAEDVIGLAYDALLDRDNPQADTVRAVVKRGDVTQSSFAFRVIKEEWIEPDDDNAAALPLRIIREMRLYDTSTVTFPAYETTDSYLRAIGLDLVTHGLGLDDDEGRSEILRALALGEQPTAGMIPLLHRAAEALESLAAGAEPTSNMPVIIDTDHANEDGDGADEHHSDPAEDAVARAAEEALESPETNDPSHDQDARLRLQLRMRLTAREKGLPL